MLRRICQSRITLTLLLPVFCGSAFAVPGSWEFVVSTRDNFDYASQVEMPPGFGDGEFTFEMWVRLNESLPVGPTLGGSDQLINWSDSDEQPYSNSSWWFHGNFLIDGHNNSSFGNGTFSLQVYGGGRIRWLFGDGVGQTGGPWAVQAYPATNTASLLDGSWHQITLVRRWSGTTSADLELWIDGVLIASETSSARTDMATTYWDGWTGYPNNQEGWFYAAEKGAALDPGFQWEDYKGLIDEIRFWSRAKSAAEIAANFDAPVVGNEPNLVGLVTLGEAQGSVGCDTLDAGRCLQLVNPSPNIWSPVQAPLSGGGDLQAPTTPTGLQGNSVSSSQIDLSWAASTDNVGVVAYDVRRNGVIVGSPAGTSFSDTGLTANTGYSYTVSARDAAGNVSAESAAVNVTTQISSDTQAPTTPTGLQGNAVSSSQIDLSWTASTDNVGVVAYDVRRDGVIVGSPAGTSFSDTGLTANTGYSYTVSARDAAGNVSAESAAVNVTTQISSDTQAPTTPTGLQGNAVSSSQIDLSWTASTDNVGVVAYDVRRDGVIVGSPAGTSFSDTGLTASNGYSYTVSARDAAGNVSAESAPVNVTTQTSSDTQAPTTPTGLQGISVSSSQIALSWTESTDNVGIENYEVQRGGIVVGTTTQARFTDNGLDANTAYVYSVRAADAAGNVSPFSSPLSLTTDVATQQSSGGGGAGIVFLAMLLGIYLPRRFRVQSTQNPNC